MPEEIELKLRLDPDDVSRFRRARVVSELGSGRAVTRTLKATYFDSYDKDLSKNKIALRIRDEGGQIVQTLKTGSTGGAGAERRGEYETRLDGHLDRPNLALLPDDVRAAVMRALGGRAIRPVFSTEVRRTIKTLQTGDGDEIELALDRGQIVANGSSEPISEVELELKRGTPASLYRVARQLGEQVPIRLGQRSKAERGYALSEGKSLSGSRKAGPVALETGMTADDALAAVLGHCMRHLVANEAAMVDAGAVEGVHQMRVALRRLRSAFTVFKPIDSSPATTALSGIARDLGESLGGARDMDVFCDTTLAPLEPELPGEKGLAELRARANAARGAAWDVARAAVRAPAYTSFVLDLALFIENRGWQHGGNDREAGRMPAEEFAAIVLGKRLHKARKLGKHLESLTLEERHELRKRLKKLRYTAEFFASLYPADLTGPYIERLGDLQDVFGDLNDVATAEHLVARLVVEGNGPTPDIERAGGLVIGWHAHRAAETWKNARKLWKRLDHAEHFWE